MTTIKTLWHKFNSLYVEVTRIGDDLHVNFRVIEFCTDTHTGDVLYLNDTDVSPEWVRDISISTPTIEGSIKWDGCSNYTYPRQEYAMLHGCGGLSHFKDECEAMSKVFEFASILLPGNEEYLP